MEKYNTNDAVSFNCDDVKQILSSLEESRESLREIDRESHSSLGVIEEKKKQTEAAVIKTDRALIKLQKYQSEIIKKRDEAEIELRSLESILSDINDDVECKTRDVNQAKRELEEKEQQQIDGAVGIIPIFGQIYSVAKAFETGHVSHAIPFYDISVGLINEICGRLEETERNLERAKDYLEQHQEKKTEAEKKLTKQTHFLTETKVGLASIHQEQRGCALELKNLGLKKVQLERKRSSISEMMMTIGIIKDQIESALLQAAKKKRKIH